MNYFIDLIYDYGLIAMFFLILIEYACFPVSSEIVLPFSGAVASVQHISFFVIILTSVAAGLIGTSICYAIGRFGGVPLIEKIKEKFPSSVKGIDGSFEKFNRLGQIAVCVGRVIPICRTYIAFVAGAVKQPYSIFLSSSAVGITVWNMILIGLGYTLRENWKLVGTYYSEYKHIIMPFLILAVILLLIKATPIKRLFLRNKNTVSK